MAAPSFLLSAVIGIILILLIIAKVYFRDYSYQPFVDASGSGGFIRSILQKQSPQPSLTQEQVQTVLDTSEVEPPYATQPIMSVDDYEYSLVFNQESDRALTKKTRDLLMSQYPMDWSNQPPSSSHFQQGLARYKEAFENRTPYPSGNPYHAIDGSDMVPPDTRAKEVAERDILQTYVPKGSDPLKYDLVDAKQLIDRIYSAKGKVADVVQKEDNVFEVIQVRDKNAKVVYEDEAPVPTGAPAPMDAVTSTQIEVPPSVVEIPSSSTLDPFYTIQPSSRQGRWDYSRWTPGLERAFAPTEPKTNWY